jgi:hypothetical protein
VKSANSSDDLKSSGEPSAERVIIRVAHYEFVARLESQLAPRTCEFFRSLLPLDESMLHCRWSGESMWVPFPPPSVALVFENHTSFPHPGEILLYANGFSEPEILLPYGACAFNSKVGQLAGNHFLTIEQGAADLCSLGHDVLWGGAHKVSFSASL